MDDFNCVVQETYTVPDPPAPPSDTLLLSPLASLHSVSVCIQDLPQTGESRLVLSPSQRTISRQLMRTWEPWTTLIVSSQNTRMLEQSQ